jgi:hypothetical protein
MIAELDDQNENGEPNEFNEVVRLFRDDNGKFLSKTCSIKVLEFNEELNKDIDIGGGVEIDLKDYIESKNENVVLYVTPKNNNKIKLVKILANITVRPSTAEVTSFEQSDDSEENDEQK